MKKVKFCVLAVIILAIFIIVTVTIQIYLISTQFNTSDDPPNAKLNVVRLFLDIAAAHMTTVFLIEPSILQAVIDDMKTGISTAEKCRYLCNERYVTTFALVNTEWRTQNDFLNEMKRSGFTLTSITAEDPRQLNIADSSPKNIVLHHFFVKSRYILHLVVFYERGDDYWWHGPINMHTTSMLDSDYITDVVIGHHAGAYDRMDTSPITLDSIIINIPSNPQSFLEKLSSSKFIECNYRRAKRFREENGDYSATEASMFRKAVKHTLKKGKKVLDELGIRFWLGSGTCLGWFRECDTIGYDDDLDIEMLINDYKPQMTHAFENSGFCLFNRIGKIENGLMLSFLSDAQLDVIFYYEEDNKMWYSVPFFLSPHVKYKKFIPRVTLCWTEFLGMKVSVPCNTQEYIETMYGKTWKQKVEKRQLRYNASGFKNDGQWSEQEWETFEIHNTCEGYHAYP